MSELAIFRTLAIIGWLVWIVDAAFITRHYIRGWAKSRAPFLLGGLLVGLANVVSTSITLAATYEPELLGHFAIYMFVIWPVIGGIGFFVIGWAVMRR